MYIYIYFAHYVIYSKVVPIYYMFRLRPKHVLYWHDLRINDVVCKICIYTVVCLTVFIITTFYLSYITGYMFRPICIEHHQADSDNEDKKKIKSKYSQLHGWVEIANLYKYIAI
jgi:hypothetical protein